ncbi:MAG: hypothetical protein ACNFW9_06390 [Candidatus Kerfeldbacteria bacterium]
MNNNTQTNNDFTAGFLTKDKSGKFKKVKDNEVVDFETASEVSQNSPQPTQIQDNQKNVVSNSSNIAPKSVPNSFQPAPRKPLSVPRAAFIAEPDDEEEIRNHQEELDKILAETPEKHVIQVSDTSKLVEELILKLGLKFEADVYKNRFIKIAESRIKEIRSSIETEEVLHRAKKIGGLELAEDEAKNIVKELNSFIKELPKKLEETQEQKIESKRQVNDEAKKQTMFAAAPPAFVPMPIVPVKKEEEPKKTKAKLFQKQPVTIEQSKEDSVQVSPEVVEKKSEVQIEKDNNQEQEQKKESVHNLYKKTPSEAMAQISKSRIAESERPQVIDIKQPSVTLGPVDEIGEIDTKQFRRMGENPASSAEKVLEKIYLLEEESWEERMMGLQAWQHSPIFKLYIELGRESIKKGISITEIVNQRDLEKKDNLHLEEFLAINSLNNQLAI